MKYLLVRRLPWILVWCSCAVLIGTSQPARAADPAVSGSAEAASAAMDAASPVKQPASTGKESRKPTKPQAAGGDTDGGSLSGADRFWIVLAVMVLMGGLFYLLFTCLWCQSWHTLWPSALAAILPEGETSRIAVLLSYSAL